jgi:hypothetical protein
MSGFDRSTAGRIARRWLYLVHRWLGVAACLFFLLWFGSGLVMMYVPYPSLTRAERLAAAPAIDWAAVAVQPTAAMAAAGLDAFPAEMRLDMAAGEPAWRLRTAAGDRIAVSAVDGRRLSATHATDGMAAAARFARSARLTGVTRITDDQWTVAQGFRWARPLWRVGVDDGRGTQLYVASTTGEVVQNTDRRERAWNWVGAVPHWLYLTAIRRDGGVWRQVVMWTAGPATIVALTGMWVGILRVRPRRRYCGGSISPYRSGWMKWHHLVGLAGGVLAVTWMASGWLSVGPFDWFARGAAPGGDRRYAAHEAADFPDLDRGALARRLPGAREARLGWVGGRAVVTLDRDPATTAIATPDGAATAFDRAALLAATRRLLPDARVADVALLVAPDLYWYSHNGTRTLPALRVKFDDPAGTWAMVDPATGALLGQQVAAARTYRWLFNALHDFDLPLLIAHRALRDPLMWLASLLGIGMSLTGIVIGWRRLIHTTRQTRAPKQRVAQTKP